MCCSLMNLAKFQTLDWAEISKYLAVVLANATKVSYF